jgi:hypothetical protein
MRGGAGNAGYALKIAGCGMCGRGRQLMRLALGLILLMVAGSAQTISPNAPEQARLLSPENAWNQAVQQKDVKAIDALLDKNLISIDYDGTVMNKGEYLASVSAPTLHFEHVLNDSMQVQIYGQSAVVVGVYREEGVAKGKPYMHRERFVDTWVNRNGAWMCVASQSTLIVR